MNYRGLKQAARACLRDSKSRYRKLTLLFLLCLGAISLCSSAVMWELDSRLALLSGLGAMAGRSRLMLVSLVVSLAASLLSSLWTMGYHAFSLALSRGEEVSFRTFFAPFRRFDRFLLLILLESVFIFLWSSLFLIPGIVAAYRYRMAPYALLDDPSLSALESLDVSKRLTYGHKGKLFFLDLTFLWYLLPLMLCSSLANLPDYFPALSGFQTEVGLYAASLILPLVLQLLFMPYFQTTMAHAYNYLRSLDRAKLESLPDGGREWRA